jgi:hypothetical protein
VISRAEVGAIGAEINFAPTPLLKNKVQQYQGFRGRCSRCSVAPPCKRCTVLYSPVKTGRCIGAHGASLKGEIYIYIISTTPPLGWEEKKESESFKLGDFK